MIHYEQGLMLSRPRLAMDVTRRQQCAFVSHAHADHMARHELALCTPETAALYRHRMGEGRRVRTMSYGEPMEFNGVRLTALSAGHCLGSAMLHVQGEQQSMLYTGDFKLGESLTAQRAEPRRADLLVMETTFGNPKYRLPPRGEVIDQLLEIIHTAFREGKTPVIHAYALGKSQEVSAILARHGVPVLQHPVIHQVSRVYESCGVPLSSKAAVSLYDGALPAGHAVVTLPRSMPSFRLPGLGEVVSISVTGWAMDPRTKYRQKVEHALPLSDHADFDELIELARLVEPKLIYTTHGPAGFDGHLRDLGYDARPLVPEAQGQLF